MANPDYDYKWACTERAMEMAEQKYGCDFYNLSDDLQHEVYCEAMESERDHLFARADHLRKAEREHGKS